VTDVQVFRCFHLYDHERLHYQICAKFSYDHSAKINPDRTLLLKSDEIFGQHMDERLFVHAFEKPIPKFVIDLEENANKFFS